MNDSVHTIRRSSVALFAAALVLCAFVTATFAARASAYNGEFCYGVYLYVNPQNGPSTCSSSTVSDIREAQGHGKDWTFVQIFQTGSPYGDWYSACSSDGCYAAAYAPHDITGKGGIQNSGDRCGCGGGDYYGWLYP